MAQRQQTGGRAKATVFLIGAIAVAALTAYLVIDVLNRAEQRVEQAGQIEKQKVIVAKNDLYMGLPIEELDIVVTEVLPGTVPADLIYSDMAELIGQTPRERIYAGEFIRFERLARQDAGVGLNAIISPGKRAMTIETDTQSSLGGFLQPGNWVDVIVTIRPDDRTLAAKWVTETILQDVKVLAVGDSLSPRVKETDAKPKKRTRNRPSVTLEVTPEEAQRLALAVSKGDLHLVLRSDVDKVQQETTGPLATDALLGIQKEEVPVAAAPSRGTSRPKPTSTVSAEVIEGATSTSVSFDSAGNKVPGVEQRRRR